MRVIQFFLCVLVAPAIGWACEPKSEVLLENNVALSVFQPSSQVSKSVLVMPPTGGRTFLDRQYSKSICRSGLRAVIVEGWDGLNEQSLDIRIHDVLLWRAQKAIQTVIEHYPKNTFGILGTSVGAIHGANALSLFPEITTGYLIAGGGPAWEVIAFSDQEDLKEARDYRMPIYGFNDLDEYSKAIKETITVEALWSSEVVAKKSVGMIVATDDVVVPSRLQENYVIAFQPEELIRMDRGHFWSIVASWWSYEQRIVRFFKDRM